MALKDSIVNLLDELNKCGFDEELEAILNCKSVKAFKYIDLSRVGYYYDLKVSVARYISDDKFINIINNWINNNGYKVFAIGGKNNDFRTTL